MKYFSILFVLSMIGSSSIWAAQKLVYKAKSGMARTKSTYQVNLQDFKGQPAQVVTNHTKVKVFGMTVHQNESKSINRSDTEAPLLYSHCISNKKRQGLNRSLSCKKYDFQNRDYILYKTYNSNGIDMSELSADEAGVIKIDLNLLLPDTPLNTTPIYSLSSLVTLFAGIQLTASNPSHSIYLVDQDKIVKINISLLSEETAKIQQTFGVELLTPASKTFKEHLPEKFVVDTARKLTLKVYGQSKGKKYILKLNEKASQL